MLRGFQSNRKIRPPREIRVNSKGKNNAGMQTSFQNGALGILVRALSYALMLGCEGMHREDDRRGGKERRLTHGTDPADNCEYSPDGEWGLHIELCLIDNDWTKPLWRIPRFGGQGTINVNSWAPNSVRFAFVSYAS
jgi:hypothetical protein